LTRPQSERGGSGRKKKGKVYDDNLGRKKMSAATYQGKVGVTSWIERRSASGKPRDEHLCLA